MKRSNITQETIEEIFQFLLTRNWRFCLDSEPKANHTAQKVRELIIEDLEDFDSLKVHLHFDKYATKHDIKRIIAYTYKFSNTLIKLHKPKR